MPSGYYKWLKRGSQPNKYEKAQHVTDSFAEIFTYTIRIWVPPGARHIEIKFGSKFCNPTVWRSWCTGLYQKAHTSDDLRKAFSTHLPVSASCFHNATLSRVCQGLVIPMTTLSWKASEKGSRTSFDSASISGRKMIFALLLPKPSTISTSSVLIANETENRQSCSEQNWRPNGFLHLQTMNYFKAKAFSSFYSCKLRYGQRRSDAPLPPQLWPPPVPPGDRRRRE